MVELNVFTSIQKADSKEKQQIVNFLFEHLEQYGDPKSDIEKAIDYAFQERPSMGGYVLTARENGLIIGGVVVNKTGMEGYIPENILVYIATHKEYRGKGIGKKLMSKAIEVAEGDIALHVEPENPARFLYEKMGFASKYVEMRFHQKKK
ncbi:GNAT family N-acetyltransferase [Marinilabiliaceae bacterium JC017]|nr:GNAT family N-acetyltransferase [Marinilabiliaceae bacterium JC017]